MLRNSFLMQKDYKIHAAVVTLVNQPEWEMLWDISADKLAQEWYANRIMQLCEAITEAYVASGAGIPTETLLTKILLGTIGCVPAFNRYFKKALSLTGAAQQSCNAKKFYAAADAYPDIRYKTAAMILLLTGMRRGELCGLEWSNIDFKEATITIERSVTTVAGIGVVDKEPKTESSKRVIAISDKLLSVLTEYKVWYDQYRYDMGDRWKETDRLFIAECGAQIYPGTVYTWVHKVCDAAGLPHRTVHSLRHTNITMQIAAGVPLVTVAGRAGHARTSTTTDIYSHFLKSSDKTAAEKLEQLFE